MLTNFDVVVVGAGTGGCVTASALAELGYSVCILDRKARTDIGNKVCGDAIGKHHFDSLGIPHPTGDELNNDIVGVDIYSPDLETRFRIRGKGLHGYMIDRRSFGQRLLNDAMDKGALLFDEVLVLDPIFKDGFVVGVTAKGFSDKSGVGVQDFYGKAVVDASGMTAVLRKKMPSPWQLEREISNRDIVVCYREIRELEAGLNEPEFIRIFLDLEAALGGYYWIFPKGENAVNVGLGVQMALTLNPKQQLYKYVLSQPLFKNSKILDSGGGIVSTRKPISSMVGNGIVFIGDAACQPNPIHGGGIGPSMMSGKTAATMLDKALMADDVSRTGLWEYNVEYMLSYGAKTASLDIFRLFLQVCSNDDLNHGMKNRLIKEEDLLKASIGAELRLNITEKARRAFRGLQRVAFLRKLSRTARKMKEIKRLYRGYPSPQGYTKWVEKVQDAFKEYEASL